MKKLFYIIAKTSTKSMREKDKTMKVLFLIFSITPTPRTSIPMQIQMNDRYNYIFFEYNQSQYDDICLLMMILDRIFLIGDLKDAKISSSKL
jgi:hypothetical protein